MKMHRWVLAAAAVLLGAFAGSARAEEGGDKPVAVTTIFSYFDALRAIAGDDAKAVILLPPGQSPHEYEPTVNDKVTVSRAKLMVLNGLNIDTWGRRLAEGNPNLTVLDISDIVKQRGIEPLETKEVSISGPGDKTSGGGGAEDTSAGNPHVWLDPRVQATAAGAIRDALDKIDPSHKAGYDSRAAAYVEDLKKLDHDFADAAGKFRQKDFIGFHSAYAYLARRYGLNQVASVEEIPDQGPSLAQTANIIHLIRDKHIKVVFTENALPAKAADMIVRETGVTTGILQPIETYDDIKQTYVSLMRANLEALKKALD